VSGSAWRYGIDREWVDRDGVELDWIDIY